MDKINNVVEVYRNLTRGCWSVRRNRRVVAHTDNIYLRYCQFVIRKGGQRRTREEGKKYVHAFIRGEDGKYVFDSQYTDGIQNQLAGWRKVVYNPHFHDTFVTASDGTVVESAEAVFLGPKGCFALNINDRYGLKKRKKHEVA